MNELMSETHNVLILRTIGMWNLPGREKEESFRQSNRGNVYWLNTLQLRGVASSGLTANP